MARQAEQLQIGLETLQTTSRLSFTNMEAYRFWLRGSGVNALETLHTANYHYRWKTSVGSARRVTRPRGQRPGSVLQCEHVVQHTAFTM